MDKSGKKNRILASLLMFFFYATFGSIVPLYTLLFQEKGFELGVISTLLLIPRIMSVVSGPLWAALADYFKLHRRLLSLAMFLSIPFLMMILIVNELAPIFILYSIFAFCTAPLIPLTDYAAVALLGKESRDFGRSRLWGAVSFGLSALLVGLLSDYVGIEVSYWVYSILMLVSGIIAWTLPEQPDYIPVPFWKGLRLILRDNRWIGLFLGSIHMGFAEIMIINYLYRYLKDIGATGSMIGISINIATLSEIPIFLFSKKLLSKVSAKKLIQVALIALTIRCFGYSLIRQPQFVYFIQLLNGLTYALFWSVVVVYVKKISPDGFYASAQALVAAAFFGIGGIFGAFGGGQLYLLIGPSRMFQVGAVGAFLGCLVFMIFTNKKTIIDKISY